MILVAEPYYLKYPIFIVSIAVLHLLRLIKILNSKFIKKIYVWKKFQEI